MQSCGTLLSYGEHEVEELDGSKEAIAAAKHMMEETFSCDFAAFITHYFPCVPHANVLDRITAALLEAGHLVPSTEQRGALVLRCFRESPSAMKRCNPQLTTETAFYFLESLANAVRINIPKPNDFQLHGIACRTVSTLGGFTFTLDAFMTNVDGLKGQASIRTPDVAVPFCLALENNEVARKAVGVISRLQTPCAVVAHVLIALQNRRKLLTAVLHIMNDDIRRNFVHAVCPSLLPTANIIP